MAFQINQSRINTILEAREYFERIISFNGSLIPFDMLLLLASAHMQNKSLTQKELFSQLPYSMMSCRQHLKRMLDQDLVSFCLENKDLRKKRIILSFSLVQYLDDFIKKDTFSSSSNFDFIQKKLTSSNINN